MSIVKNRQIIESTLGQPNLYAVFSTRLTGTYAIRTLDVPWQFNTLWLSPNGWIENEECLENFLTWNGIFERMECLVKCIDEYAGFTVGNYYVCGVKTLDPVFYCPCISLIDDDGDSRFIDQESDCFDFGEI